jgi:UDP-glucose 4-epimerase
MDMIKEGKPIPLTDPNMTRFMMTLDDAVDLVLFAFNNAKSGEIFVQKAPAATIRTMIDAICELMRVTNYPTKLIGTRHGEKLYEALLSREEVASSVDMGCYFMVPPDTRDLNYDKYYINGELKIASSEDYNSHNTKRLNKEEMMELLLKVPYVKAFIKGNQNKALHS